VFRPNQDSARCAALTALAKILAPKEVALNERLSSKKCVESPGMKPEVMGDVEPKFIGSRD